MVVEWKKIAFKQFEEIYKFVKLDSEQSANKLKTDIIEHLEKLAKHPETRPLDKYKLNNDGTFRYLEMRQIRVHYRVISQGISILRVRHTSRQPLYH